MLFSCKDERMIGSVRSNSEVSKLHRLETYHKQLSGKPSAFIPRASHDKRSPFPLQRGLTTGHRLAYAKHSFKYVDEWPINTWPFLNRQMDHHSAVIG